MLLRERCLAPPGFSVTEATESLGVSRMAIRLSITFDTTAESWLQQMTAVRTN